MEHAVLVLRATVATVGHLPHQDPIVAFRDGQSRHTPVDEAIRATGGTVCLPLLKDRLTCVGVTFSAEKRPPFGAAIHIRDRPIPGCPTRENAR